MFSSSGSSTSTNIIDITSNVIGSIAEIIFQVSSFFWLAFARWTSSTIGLIMSRRVSFL